MIRWVIVLFLLSFSSGLQAQQIKEKKKGWHLLDLEKDGYY